MVGSAIAERRDRVVARLEAGGNYRRWVLITALVGMFSTTFPVTLLTVSLGDIADDFGVTDTLMTWVVSAPFLASAVALPVLGKMGDLYGQRRVFLIGFVLATIIAGVTAAAPTAIALIGLRTLSQVVGSATQPTSMALIMRVYPAEERVKAMGWWSLVAAGAPAIGLIVGAPLVDAIGWRFLFITQAVLSVVPVVAAALVLKEVDSQRAETRFDIPGAASLAASAGFLVFALNQSPDWGWTHPVILGCLVLFPVAAVAFVRIEQQAEFPLVPPSMMKHRNFAAALVAQGLAGATYMGGFALTPFFMRDVLGWTTGTLGLLMAVRTLTFSLSSPVGGRFGTAVGERRATLTGLTVLAGSMAIFAVGAAAEAVVLIAIALFVQGLGNGLARPSIGSVVANSVDEDDMGIASASQRMFQLVGNSVGIALLTAVYGGVNTAESFMRVYIAAFIIGTLAVLVATRMQDAVDRSS